MGDRAGEGEGLWKSRRHLSQTRKFPRSHTVPPINELSIVKEVGDRAGEGTAYGNLGSAHNRLGNFQEAIEYHNKCLSIVKEVGNRANEGKIYGNLGNVYCSLGKFQEAIEYHQ